MCLLLHLRTETTRFYHQNFIESFDQFVILLKNTVNQMVYKHAISTVVPARSVSHHNSSHHVATPEAVESVETQAE